MPKPTDTAEFLNELNGGAFASQIGHALSGGGFTEASRSLQTRLKAWWLAK